MRVPFIVVSLVGGIGVLAGEALQVTNLANDGAGSLRAQIEIANSDPDLSVIEFPVGMEGMVSVTSPLIVEEPLHIRAGTSRSVILDGGGVTRVLVMNGASLNEPHVLEGLVIQNGSATLGGANVRVFGSLQLRDCVVRNGRSIAINGSRNSPQNADGGGLFHSGGHLQVSDSLFSGNEAVGGFSQGGGLYTERGTANLVRTRIVGNTTDGLVGEGGGLGSRSVTVIEDCEISENETLGPSSGGGGIYTDDGITIRQSTISGNIVGATTGVEGYSVGGAFANVGGSDAVFISCTITGNSAPTGKGQGAGISSLSRGVLSFRNCIVAGNLGGGDLDETPSGEVVYRDEGWNLFGVVTDTNLEDPANRSETSRYEVGELGLSDLKFSGGLTRAHLPLTGSPAIDAGGALGEGSPRFDQRGGDFPRVVGGQRDIGAIEQQRFIDRNGNLLPDAVELVIDNFEESDGDLDGDGFGDALEFTFLGIAAISDNNRRPALQIQFDGSTGGFSLQFPSSSNREYRLLSGDDLTAPLQAGEEEGFTRFPGVDSGFFSTAEPAPRSFFQIEARVPATF